jgi:ADP-heptose:LPS heptosyltransferase
VVRLGAMGDVVRTLPAVSSLRAGYPGSHIAWLVEPRSASALDGQPWIDEVLVFPRPDLVAALRSGELLRSGAGLRGFARALRERRFDLVVDFHSLLRSALLARLTGAPVRAGYARPFGRELSWALATHRARLAPGRISRFERNQALVRYLGVTAPPAPAPFRIDPAARVRAEAALPAGPAPIVLHPGSSDGTAHKRWPIAAYAALARELRDTEGAASLVSFGPARDDRARAEAVVREAGGAARLAPATPSVADLGALLACARLYVGGDTGPMHVASLVGTPVVQILGPTDPVENAPWSLTPSRSVRAGAGECGGAAADVVPVLAAARSLLAETRVARRAAGGRP